MAAQYSVDKYITAKFAERARGKFMADQDAINSFVAVTSYSIIELSILCVLRS